MDARTTTATLTSSGALHHCERPMLLLHGFLATARVVGWLADRLGRSGYCAHDVELGGLFGRFNARPMEELARVVAERVEQLARDHRCQRIDLVGHSAGGLIGRYYVQKLEGARRVRHLVTLGTPHRGTPWAFSGPLLGRVLPSLRQMTPGSPFLRDLADDTFPDEVRLTSIYSHCDMVCPPSSCRLEVRRGAHLKNVEVARGGHLEFLFSAEISSIICREFESVEPAIPARPRLAGAGSFRSPATRAADGEHRPHLVSVRSGDRLPASRPGEILAAQGSTTREPRQRTLLMTAKECTP
jgi:triacylglycerol lipase